MIEGKTITLAGREFIAPPAPFAVMRKYKDVFNGDAVPDMLMMADVVFAALQRNYPELSQAEFEEKYLDVGNISAVFNAIMKSGGVEEIKPGEAAAGNP